MFKARRLAWRSAAWQMVFAALVIATILAGQRIAQAQTVTLNSPSASALQTLLQSGQSGPLTIYLNFTNTLVTTTPLFVTYPNTLLIATNTNAVFFSGNNTSQVFYVEPGVKFIVQNVTISGGNSTGLSGVNGTNGSSGGSSGGDGTAGTAGTGGFGGAIFNNGNTTLIGCSLLTNTAAGGNGGSGGGGGNGSNFGGNGGSGGSGGAGYGGAIYNLGTLTLSNCTVAGNTATGGNGGVGGTNGSGSFAYSGPGGGGALGAGGGVFNAAGAVLNITNCTFNNNFSQGGTSQAAGGAPNNGNGQSGIAGADAEGAGVQNLGTARIVNSTFFQNTVTGGNGGNGGNATTGAFAGAGGDGGSAYGGGIFNSSAGFVAVTNCTFYGSIAVGGTNGAPGTGSHTNSIGSPGVGYGANVVNNGGTFKIKNSLLSGPVGASNAYYATTAFTDQDNNITSDNTPAFTQTNSFIYTFPKLILPAFNGGPTETMALQPGSPAINRVFDGSAPPFDQRGVRRPLGKRPCSGAFEFGSVTFTISGQITPPTNSYTNVTIVAQSTDFTYSTQPDANGNYTFQVAADTYNIIPQPTNGFIFNPPSSNSITVGTTNVAVSNVDFAATAVFNLGGQISNVTSSVTVTINNGGQFSSQTTTDTNGFFIFTNLVADSYTIMPQASGTYTFVPTSFTTNVPPTTTNVDVFVAYPALSTVSGQIANIQIPVTIAVNNGSSNTYYLSSATGSFSIPSLSAGTYIIQPLPTNGITFTPSATNVTLPPGVTVNFTATTTNQPTVSFSGVATNQTIQFSVSGAVSNLDYLIQASTNLSNPSDWVTIATNKSVTNGGFTFTNSMTNSPQRFYRVIIP